MPPFACKGGYVEVICNRCIVKYLSYVVLRNLDKKTKPNQFFKERCRYSCNISIQLQISREPNPYDYTGCSSEDKPDLYSEKIPIRLSLFIQPTVLFEFCID